MGRKIFGTVAVAVALLALMAVAPGSPASAGGDQICGTIRGNDNRYVRATIGVVLYQGSTVRDYNGGGGYSLDNANVNSDMPTDQGVVPGSPEDTGYTDTFCFQNVPTEVDGYLFEVYPRDGDGDTSYARYGGVSRSKATLPGGGQPLPGATLRLPLRCEQGGTTGSITVQAYSNGVPTTIGRVLAVGEAASPLSGIQGFSITDGGGNGPTSPLVIGGLEPNQRYSVQVTFANRSRKSIFAEIAVRPCETTVIRAWTGSTPAGTPGRWSSRPMTVNGSYFPVPGDFTGDGLDDIFFYAPGSPMDYLWEGVGVGSGFVSRPFPVNGSYRPTSGDYDGDGVDDLYFFAPGTAQDYVWYFDEGGETYTSTPMPANGTSTTTTRSGDFDGDGRDDILFYNPNGSDSIWYFEPARVSRPVTIGGSSNVVVGDVNGDLRDDIYQHNTTTGGVRMFFGTAGNSFNQATDGTGRTYRPIMGDLSCDLRADVIQYQPGTGSDTLWRGRSTSAPIFAKESALLGINGSYLYPFTGDFDGNGCADVFWYQPGSGSDVMWLNSQIGWNKAKSTTSGSF